MPNTKTLSTTIANPIRTGVQGGVAWGITEILDSFAILPMDERQYAAVLLVLTMVVGAIQNGLENWKGVAFLRKVPQPEAPVLDTTPTPPTPPVGN